MTKMMIAAAVLGSFFAATAAVAEPKLDAYYGETIVVRVETSMPEESFDVVAAIIEEVKAEDAMETAELPDDVGTQLAGLFNPTKRDQWFMYMRDRYGRRYTVTLCPFDKSIQDDTVGCGARMWDLVGVYASLDYTDHSMANYAKAKSVLMQMPRLMVEYREQLQALEGLEKAGLEAEVAEVGTKLPGLTAKLAVWRHTVEKNGGWDVLESSDPLVQLREAQMDIATATN